MTALLVMGVSGAGKSSFAAALAQALGYAFIEGDALHPPANVAKMAAGVPLTDADRWPWLERVTDALNAAPDGAVATCSALRRGYRDRLRERVRGLTILHLALDRGTLDRRLGARSGHYMPASLLDSQLATLEPPAADEQVVILDAAAPVATLLAQARAELRRRSAAGLTPPEARG